MSEMTEILILIFFKCPKHSTLRNKVEKNGHVFTHIVNIFFG